MSRRRTLEGIHGEILEQAPNRGRHALARALRHIHRHPKQHRALRARLKRAQQRHEARVDYGYQRRVR
jgi:hypothetical protein